MTLRQIYLPEMNDSPMPIQNPNSTALDVLVEIGLTQTEAEVYYELLKFGKAGTRVFDLLKSLQRMNRTTLYSILSKMESSGMVLVTEGINTPRNARSYSALPPLHLLQQKIEDLQAEIDRLKELEPMFKRNLNDVYMHGATISLESINNEVKPYIKPLLDGGWKIKSIVQEEHLPVLNYSVYDIVLHTDTYIFLDEIPFHLFIFDEDIESNKQLMQIMVRSITIESKKYISAYLGKTPYEMYESRRSILNHDLPVFQIRIHKANLEASLIPPVLQYLGAGSLDDIPEEVDLTFGVVIIFQNRLFYVWAESLELIEKAIAPIFSIEYGIELIEPIQ